MIFKVDIDGENIPMESNMLDGRITRFETAKEVAYDIAARLDSPAGQVSLVGDGKLLGHWVRGNGEIWWETAA
jgi:hypothetical protein